jgi:putative spermidine/putrescine transport system ATP-binding protein
MYSVDGRVRDVIYLGLYTRYLVELDGGSDLVVVEQNLHTTSMDVLSARGRPVRLLWRCDHIRPVSTPA